MIQAEGHLEALRKRHIRIEVTQLRRRWCPICADGRLVHGVERRCGGSDAEQKQLLRPLIAVRAPEPRVRRTTTEQANAPAQKRAPSPPQIVIEGQPRRPQRLPPWQVS